MALAFLNRLRVASGTPIRTAPAQLGFDFHSHLLPAVDDGMESFEQSCDAIAQMKALGFAGAVTTPHIYHGVFENHATGLRAAFETLCAQLAAIGEVFPLHLAAEYFTDEHFLALIGRDDLLYLPVGDERWVLVEFPYAQESPYAAPCLAALVARGYRPVIAHIERYRFVAAATDAWLDRFAAMGCVLQGDIGSLVGQFGRSAQRLSEEFLERKLVSLWGTDLHKPGQIGRHIVPGLGRLAGIERLNAVIETALLGGA
jgi:tyrosine-protein phosphatase YwqE